MMLPIIARAIGFAWMAHVNQKRKEAKAAAARAQVEKERAEAAKSTDQKSQLALN